MRDQLQLCGDLPVLEHHERLHGFSVLAVRNANDHSIPHGGMPEQHLLDFTRVDTLAARLDHVFLAVHQKGESCLILTYHVAGVEPAFSQDRLCFRLVVPVPLHHLRSPDKQFAGLAG